MRFILGLLSLFTLIACKPVEVSPTERVLDVNQANTQVTTIDRYFSIYSYGSTLRFYHFKDQNTVLQIRFSDADSNFDLTASINVFSNSETPENIALWINNQHSDALYGSAPTPESVNSLDTSNYSIVSSELLNTEVGTDGFGYDNYKVTFHINPLTKTGLFKLAEFTDDVVVHVRKEKTGSTEERPLDVANADTQVTNIDGYFSPYRYGNSLRLYHFQSQNAVLKFVMPNTDTNFQPRVSLVLFAKNETVETISRWMNNQYSDALYGDAPQPTASITLDSKFTITASQLIGSETGPSGEQYDNYQIKYSTNSVTEPGVYSLAGFSDNVVVHVLTKAVGSPLKVLDVAAADTQVIYGNVFVAKQMYHFRTKNTVLLIVATPKNSAFELNASVNIFSDQASESSISAWIHNQYEDYLDGSAAQPVKTVVLTSDRHAILGQKYTGTFVGVTGSSYDHYEVSFSIYDFSEGDLFHLIGFTNLIKVRVLNASV